jgi:short-subunit dehydrogenase
MGRDPFYQNSVIVTGASSGIGRCLALQLAEKGARLALAARTATELERVAELCHDRGGRAVAVPIDVSDQAQCKVLIDRAVEEYGCLDTLINNAGAPMYARFDELEDLSVMKALMEANFWGSVYCTHHALQHLKETTGRIVVVISGAGLFVAPMASGYGVAKHALAGFFDTLRFELRGSGVTVTTIYPGWVATGISAKACGVDGSPTGTVSKLEASAMSPDQCAQSILKAAARRKRDAMPQEQRLGLLLAPIFPKYVDETAARNFVGDDYRPVR